MTREIIDHKRHLEVFLKYIESGLPSTLVYILIILLPNSAGGLFSHMDLTVQKHVGEHFLLKDPIPFCWGQKLEKSW